MTPNPQAARQASIGLALLAQDGNEWGQTPAALLATKIRDQQTLTPDEINKIREFHHTQLEPTPAWVMASQLYGGQPLLDQIQATPPAPKQPKARIAATLRPDATALLKTNNQHPCTSITLAEIGDTLALSEMTRLQTELACETLTKTTAPTPATAKWQTQTVTASGYETRIHLDSPPLHALRQKLEATLNAHGVPYDHTTVWTPTLTRDITPIETPQLFAPFNSTIDTITLHWGTETEHYPITGTPNPITATSTKPATSQDVLTTIGNQLLQRLKQLDERWLTGLEAIIEMSVNQAIEKVGRTLKKRAPEQYLTITAAAMKPAAAAVTADSTALKNINVNQLIAAPIDDAIKQTQALTRAHIDSVQTVIGTRLGLTINQRTKYIEQLKTAATLLKNRLKDWIKWRLCTPDGEAKLDDFTTVLTPPADLVRDYAQTAGGAAITKDDSGRYQPNRETNPAPALAVGATGLAILARAVDALKGAGGSQFTIVDTPQLPASEIQALRDIRPDSEINLVESYTWTPNYYGTIRTEHHPDHEPRFGLVVEDPTSVTGRVPGDHPHCKCGWDPNFSFEIS